MKHVGFHLKSNKASLATGSTREPLKERSRKKPFVIEALPGQQEIVSKFPWRGISPTSPELSGIGRICIYYHAAETSFSRALGQTLINHT